MLGATVQNVVTATWCPGFVHP